MINSKCEISSLLCVILVCLWREVYGETFQYFLDIENNLDPEWEYAQHVVGTKIQCASVCYTERDRCFYFGYKNHSCYLLKDNVDKDQCSLDDCEDNGMKIYKMKIPSPETTTVAKTTTEKATTEKPTTTTIATTTLLATTSTTERTTTTEPTSTTVPTTTTTKPTTTTTEPTTTTTEPPTTSTEPPTTTTERTTTTTEPTTTTTEPTTTTTEPTTTTTEPTTTTTEPTTTTTVPATTTEPTTTTTEPTTTTTEKTTTTTIATTTAGDPFRCDPPDGASAEIKCPVETYLLKALGSKSPFFGDALSPTCSTFKDMLVSDKEEEYVFFSPDGGFSVKAQCKSDDYVIYKYTLCVMDAHIPAILLKCRKLLDTSIVKQVLNASSELNKNALVNCGSKTALQRIYMMDAGDKIVTKVIYQCVELDAEELADTGAAESAAADTAGGL